MKILRSLLFIPGNRPDMLAKANKYFPDAFIPDMEDSVPLSEKRNAMLRYKLSYDINI